jgi:hypothetical protein
MSKDNLGGIFAILKEIADELGWNYSHGNMTEMSLKAVNVYPLQHCTIQSITVQEQIATYSINIIIADLVNFLKTENEQLNLVTLYSELGIYRKFKLCARFARFVCQVQFEIEGKAVTICRGCELGLSSYVQSFYRSGFGCFGGVHHYTNNRGEIAERY